jgi:hypothetical protein
MLIAVSALSGDGANSAPGTVIAACSATFDAPMAIHAGSSATGTKTVIELPDTVFTTKS